MTKLILALGLCFTTMCSFMCTKSNDDVVMRQAVLQSDDNVTIDMSQFPARTKFTIMDEVAPHTKWDFDSDSLKTYHVNIPANSTYTITWRLLGVTPDTRYKAFIRYHDKSNINAEWKNDIFTQTGWKIWGNYAFTRELK